MESDNSYVKEPKKKRSDGKTPAQRTAQAKKAATTRKKNARAYMINPILDKIINNMKVTSFKQDRQYEKQVDEWRPKLLGKRDPWINTEKFMELFEMYDFVGSKPPQEDWFSFKISAKLALGESQRDIFVIEKLYEKITETDIALLIAKLQNHRGIIITMTNDTQLDFSYDADKICLIDKEMIEWLLLYRIDRLKRRELYMLIKGKKQ